MFLPDVDDVGDNPSGGAFFLMLTGRYTEIK
jgi:hypothetical protein